MKIQKNDGYESDYHETLHKNLNTNEEYYKARAKLALIKYFNNISKDSKILEFGCGLGQNIFLLKNSVGYDISEFALDFCRKKGINATNDLKKIPDNSFDIVFSAHVLEHLENPFHTLKEMHKKLKKDGKLILILPVEHRKKNNKNIDQMDISQHLYAWTFKTINNILLKSGFEPIENSYLYGSGYKKLLPISKINFKLYKLSTKMASVLVNSKEMKIVAIKK
jgi:ubiquinone/menaquinone biosynthesis C-methylase UbiE